MRQRPPHFGRSGRKHRVNFVAAEETADGGEPEEDDEPTEEDKNGNAVLKEVEEAGNEQNQFT